jgi:cell division protein FtsL
VGVLGSAVALVYANYSARLLFVEKEALRREREDLNIEWGRLQLEQSTWAAHGRIEAKARKELRMRMVSSQDVKIIRP